MTGMRRRGSATKLGGRHRVSNLAMTSGQPGPKSERPPHVRSRSSGQRNSQALQSAEDDAGMPSTEENWTSSSEEQDDSEGILEWTARRHKDDRKDDSRSVAPAAPASLSRTSEQGDLRHSSDALPRRPHTPHGGGGIQASQSMTQVGSAPSPSVSSLRSSSSMMLGRHGLMPRTPSAPKPQLDTHKVLMDRHEVAADSPQPQDAAGGSGSKFYMPPDDVETLARPSRSTSSDNVAGHPAALGRRRLDSVSSLSNIAGVARPQAQRTMSTQSLADVSSAAQRQPPRSSRQYLDELLGREPTGGTNTPPGGMGAVLQAGRFVDRPSKPLTSKFASYQHQFDTGATSTVPQRLWASQMSDMPGRIVSVEVPPGSVFSPGFVDRVRHRIEQDRTGSLRRNETPGREKEPPSPDTAPSGEPRYRYLLDYALSGPPIDPVAVQDVDLAPQPAASMNPSQQKGLVSWGSESQLASLSEAARSRTRLASSQSSASSSGGEGSGSGRRALTHWRSKALVQDSSSTLGPNMIPFHFIHALTSAMDNALALDHTEVPAMAALLPGVPEHGEGEELAEAAAERSEDECLLLIDNPSMRAIACTVQAVSVQRQHTVTRRFSDPMRAALERVADAGGYKAHLPHSPPRRSTQRRPPVPVRSRLPRADSS